jgi:hypothetical protein
MRSAPQRPVLIAGILVAAVVVLVAGLVFSGQLGRPAASGPGDGLAVTTTLVDAPTVIDVPTDLVASTTVRAAGATVVADDVTIVVPQGAVSADTDIEVQRLNAPFHLDDGAAAGSDAVDARPVGPAFDLGPAGTKFDQPVDVTLPYDGSIVPDGTDPNQIVVAYYTGTHWAVAGGKADVAAHTVTVRLQAFPGLTAQAVLLTILAGLVINRAIHYKELRDNPNAYDDPVIRGEARQYVTPDASAVQAAAAGATAGGVFLADQTSLAEYMAKQGQKSVKVTLTPGGKPRTASYDGGPGTNWRMPIDYLSRDMQGDCTDATNTMVSVFRTLGYQAKGVEGYAGDKGHPHAWGEVLIGDKAYMIDQNGELQVLPEAIELNHLIRADKNDPRDYMWDETGQQIYKRNWWRPTVLTVTPTSIADGQIDKNYNFKASATRIPDTAESVRFEWYQNGELDTEWQLGGVLPPYQEPLTTPATFTFHERGSYLIKEVMFATFEGAREEIARATVRVRIKSATASPSASASKSALSSKGYWQFVEAKNYPDDQPFRPGAEWTITADSGHLQFVSTSPDQGPSTVEWNCTWTAAKRLEPGKIVEATVGCKDSSQKNSDGNWFGIGPGMTTYIEPPLPGTGGETWCLELRPVDYQESGSAKAACSVPAGPLASDPWNGRIALQFNFGHVGYTQWIYKWVPGA